MGTATLQTAHEDTVKLHKACGADACGLDLAEMSGDVDALAGGVHGVQTANSRHKLTDSPSILMPSLRRNSFSLTMLPTTACGTQAAQSTASHSTSAWA
jgi:hypothetical protein